MNDDFKPDELIEVKLPRKDYELLRTMLTEREAKNWLTAKVSSWWLFGAGAGALVLWKLYSELAGAINGGS